MESQLSKQLRFLRSTLPQASDDTKSSDSFLFNPKKAASLRTDEIRILSLSGLNALVKYDRRFDSFKETIFSANSLELKRELHSQEVNEKIDTSISSFLRLLGPFLLLRPAQKSIEYLIRKYRCHHFNVDELMALFLPYHNTILFPAIIRILHVDGSMWGFLEKLKATQEAIPRSAIVSRCVNDFTVIEFVMDQLRIGGVNHRAYINFYTTLLVEYVNELKVLDDLKLKRLLTTVFWSLSHEEFEIRCSGLMILTQISSKMNFTRDLFSEITNLVSSNIDRIRPRPSIIFLVYLYQSQNSDEMSNSVLRRILDCVPLLIEVVKELSTTYSPGNFLTSFLRSLLGYSMNENENEDSNNNKSCLDILLKWLNEYDGIEVHVSDLIPDLFEHYQSQRTKIRKILRVVEARYPKELDLGIKKSVRLSRVKNDGELLEFIRLTFRGTQHHLTERGDQTLTFILFHTDPSMRALGIREMERLVHHGHYEKKKKKVFRDVEEENNMMEDEDDEAVENNDEEQQQRENFLKFVSDSLLSSLDDSSLTVLREVFNFRNVLSFVPLEEFVPKSIEVFRSLKPKLRKDRRVGKIIKKVARLFTNSRLFEQEEGVSYQKLILPFVLEFLYAEKTLKKTNIHIFNSLPQLEGLDLFRGSEDLIKRTESMNAGKRNHELIQFLARNILDVNDPSRKDALMRQWIGYGRNGSALKLVLFVLNEVFGSRGHQDAEHLQLFMNLVSPIIEKMGVGAGSSFRKNLFKKVATGNSNPSIKNREFNLPTLSVFSLYVISKSLPKFSSDEDVSSSSSSLESTAKELFIRISSHPDCVSLFTPHLTILLDKLGQQSVSFFSTCWVSEGCDEVPVSTVKRSVDICGRLVRLNAASHDFRRLLIPLVCCSCSRQYNRKDIRVSLKTLVRYMMDSANNPQQQQGGKEVYKIDFLDDDDDDDDVKHLSNQDYLRILQHFFQSDITESTEDVIFRMDGVLRTRFLEFVFSCFRNIPSVQGKILLLKSFVKIRNNPKKIDYTLPVLKSLVRRMNELTVKETELLDLLIETVQPRTPSTDIWENFIKPTLGLTDPIPNVPTYVPSQSCQGIILTKEYFDNFTDNQKKETFLEIFEVFRDKRSRTRDITISLHRTLKRLSFPPEIINEIWNQVTKSDFVSPSNRMEDDDEDAEETSFHNSTILLELLHILNFQLPLTSLIVSLNNTLSTLLTLPAPPSYLMGLVLSLLTKLAKTLLETQKEDGRTIVVDESSSSFSIDLLLRVIDTFTKREEEGVGGMQVDPNTSPSDIRSEILILFSSLVELVPTKVVPHVSSLLQFLGTSLQTRDSDTIEMVERFVKKMVPFFVSSSSEGESDEGNNRMIVSITSAYCDAWESLPMESRKRSFASLVKAVGRKRLHLVMIRYLSSVRNREEIDGVKRPEQREFARSLIRYFTIPKQVRCLVELVEYCEKVIQNPLENHSSGFYEKSLSFDDEEEDEIVEEKYEFGLYLLEFVMSFLSHIEFLSDIANFERSDGVIERKKKKKKKSKKKKNEDVVQELILGLLIHSVRLYTSSRSQRSKLLSLEKKKESSRSRHVEDESDESDDDEEEEGEDEDEDENETIDILDEIIDILDGMVSKIMQLVSTNNFVRFIVSLLRSTKKRKEVGSYEDNLRVLTKTISILNTRLADKTIDNTKRLNINSKLYCEKLLPKITEYLVTVNIFSIEEAKKKKKKKVIPDLKKNDFFLGNTRLCQSLIITLELMARRFIKFGKTRFLPIVTQLVNHFESLMNSFCFDKRTQVQQQQQQQNNIELYFVSIDQPQQQQQQCVESYISSISMTCCSYFKEMGMSAMSDLPKLASSTMKLFQKISSVENNIRKRKEEDDDEDEDDDDEDLLERRMNSIHLYISGLKHSIFVLLKSHGQFFSSQNLKDTLDVLFHLSKSERKYGRAGEENEEKEGSVVLSFSERMRNVMLQTVPLRVTLPILLSSQIFHQARNMSGPGPFRFLMRTLSYLLRKTSSNDLSSFDGEIVDFFMNLAFCIREKNQENGRKKPEMIEQEENQVIHTLLSYVLKLNEDRLYGLISRIISWTDDRRTTSQLNFTRMIIFFKILNTVIEKLDILFLPLCAQKRYSSIFSENEEDNFSLIEICGKLMGLIVSLCQKPKKKKKKDGEDGGVIYSGGGRKRLFSEREEEIEKEQEEQQQQQMNEKSITSQKEVSQILLLIFEFMETIFKGMSSKSGREIINKTEEKKKKRNQQHRQTEDELILGMDGEDRNKEDIVNVYRMIERSYLVPMVKQMEIVRLQVSVEDSITQDEMMGLYETREKKWLDCLCSMVGCIPNSYSEFHDTTHKLFVSYLQKTIMVSSSVVLDKERVLLSFLRGLNGCYESNLQWYVGYLPKSVPLMKEVREKYGDENEMISEEIEEFIEIVEDFETEDGEEVEVRDLIMS